MYDQDPLKKVMPLLNKPSRWVESMGVEDSAYKCGKDVWTVPHLLRAVQEQRCRPYRLPIKHLDLSVAMEAWTSNRLCDVAYDARRIMRADLTYPVIIGPVGTLLDGYHRVAKAVALGLDHVMAVRLKDMPAPDQQDEA